MGDRAYQSYEPPTALPRQLTTAEADEIMAELVAKFGVDAARTWKVSIRTSDGSVREVIDTITTGTTHT